MWPPSPLDQDGDLAATRLSTAEHASWLIEASVLCELGVEGGTMTVQEVAEREGVHPINRSGVDQSWPAACGVVQSG